MRTTVDLLIVPDKPTSRGNIYSANACNTVVNQINKRARNPMKGYFMERNRLHPIGKPAYKILGAEIDGSIKIHIETLGTMEGKLFESMVRANKVQFLPVIETGNEQPLIVNGKPVVTEIKKLISIGVNADPIIRAQLGAEK